METSQTGSSRLTYDAVWQDFRNGDHITQAPIWGGAGLALIVPVTVPEVVVSIRKVQAQLAASLPFIELPPETLHITLRLFGNPDEVKTAGLIDFLSDALASVTAISIALPRVNSFFRAPFYEVDDGGALSVVQAQIRPWLIERGFPEYDYGPRGQIYHVTLGAYTQSNDGAEARRVLAALRSAAAGSFRVNLLQLIRASAGAPYRLEMVRDFPLK